MKIVKAVLLISLFAFPAVASDFSYDEPEVDSIRAHSIKACTYWRHFRSGYDSGYMCSNYPMSIQVPDAYSVASVIGDLERRIDELERQVRELQQRE
ncbi:hypothetical protein ACFLRA_02960 [Bdellovibrionota bacterium]